MSAQLSKLYLKYQEDPAFRHLRDNANFVPGAGDCVSPRAILIGEAPGRMEDRNLRPFCGPAGRVLDGLLAAAQLSREEVWITNVIKYRPEKNRTPDIGEIKAARIYLRSELQLIDCRNIVLLGRVARTLAMITDESPGSVIQKNGWTMFTVYHPAAALYTPSLLPGMEEHFRRIGKAIRG